MWSPSGHLLFISLLSLTKAALSTLQTIKIDDRQQDYGDLVELRYSGPWNQAPPCGICRLRPAPSLAHNQTWMDATHYAGDSPVWIEIQFSGVSIEIVCIVPNQVIGEGTFTNYNLTFVLDQQPIEAPFIHSPDSTADFTANVPVFSVDSLANTKHSVIMSLQGDSIALFDYAIVKYNDSVSPSTTPVPPASSPSADNQAKPRHNPTIPIAVALSVLAALSLAGAIFTIIRKRRRRSEREGIFVEPFTDRTVLPSHTSGKAEQSLSSGPSHAASSLPDNMQAHDMNQPPPSYHA